MTDTLPEWWTGYETLWWLLTGDYALVAANGQAFQNPDHPSIPQDGDDAAKRRAREALQQSFLENERRIDDYLKRKSEDPDHTDPQLPDMMAVRADSEYPWAQWQYPSLIRLWAHHDAFECVDPVSASERLIEAAQIKHVEVMAMHRMQNEPVPIPTYSLKQASMWEVFREHGESELYISKSALAVNEPIQSKYHSPLFRSAQIIDLWPEGIKLDLGTNEERAIAYMKSLIPAFPVRDDRRPNRDAVYAHLVKTGVDLKREEFRRLWRKTMDASWKKRGKLPKYRGD